jgi:hypothetical protein
MAARGVWALLVVGSLIVFGCGGDSFEPPGAQGGSGPGDAPSGGSGGGKTAGNSGTGASTGGSDVHPASGGRGSSIGSGGTPFNTGGTGGARTSTGGSGSGGDISFCPDSGVPTLERVVASCVADSKTMDAVFGCISSLGEEWLTAAARYLACTDCEQVRTQVDCLMRACRNDADGLLTLQDLVTNCAWTLSVDPGFVD